MFLSPEGYPIPCIVFTSPFALHLQTIRNQWQILSTKTEVTSMVAVQEAVTPKHGNVTNFG